MSENPGNMRRAANEFRTRSQTPVTAAELGTQASLRTRSGRRLATADTATVALALSGMTFYWMMMPALRRRQRRRKPPVPPTSQA